MARNPLALPTFAASQFINTAMITQMGAALVDACVVAAHLKLPIAYTTGNNETLLTVPTGYRFRIEKIWWEITTSFSGGSSSAIGVSSDDVDYNTAGDLLGGASGNLAATLVSTGRVHKQGTLGTKFGSNEPVVIGSGKVVRFNQITSAFTAGAGFVHIDGHFVD